MSIHNLWSRGATPLFFYQYLRLERGTGIIGSLVGNAHLYRFVAFVSRRRVEIKAVTARMQIGPTILALVGRADLVHDLDFQSAIIAACNQVEFRFHSPARAFRARGWFGLSLPFPV
jgi:hypothetical protein